MMKLRKPTKAEKLELITYWLQNYIDDPTEEDREELEEATKEAAIAVFDDYCTDSPIYAGKVMVVVWPAGPSFTEVYIWDRFYDNGKVNIPVCDTRSPAEGKYTPKMRSEGIDVNSLSEHASANKILKLWENHLEMLRETNWKDKEDLRQYHEGFKDGLDRALSVVNKDTEE